MSRRSPNLESWNPMEEDFENVGFNSYRGGTCLEPSDFSMAAQGGKTKKNFDYQLVQLHVNKIPAEMDEKGLTHLFGKFGRVVKAKIIHPKGISGPKFVFGKVEYESVNAALTAIQTYHLKPPLNLDIQLDRQCFVNGEMPAAFQNIYNNRGESDSGSVRRTLLPTPSSRNAHSYDGNKILDGRSSRIYGSNQSISYKQMGNAPLPITVTTVAGASYDRKVNFSHENVGNKATVRVMNSTFSGKNSPGRVQRNAEICIKCNTAGSFRCGTCKAVYCSVVCQKEDWPKHKFICLPSSKKIVGLLKTPDDVSHRATPFASHSDDGASEHLGKTVGSATQTGEHKQHRFGRKNELDDQEHTSSIKSQPKNELSPYGHSHVPPKYKQTKDRPNNSVSKSIQTDLKQSVEEVENLMPNVQEVGTTTDRMLMEKEPVTVAVQAAEDEEMVKVSGKTAPQVNDKSLLALSEAPAHAEKEKEHNKEGVKISHKSNEKLLCQTNEKMPQKPSEEKKVDSYNEEVSHKEIEKVPRKESEEVQNKSRETAPCKEIAKVPKNEEDILTLAVDSSLSAPALAVSQTAPKPKHITLPTDHPVQVVVTHASTPHSFYVQLLDKTDLTAVMCKLQSVEGINPPESVHMNQLVAAKFSFDDVWYRAKVEKVDGDQVTVQYVDYGNTETVSLKNVRLVSPEIFALPIQCAWCRLANIEPLLGKWSDDAVESFSACVCDVPLYASVTNKSCGDLQCVTLSDRESGGADRGDLMIFTNLATHSLPIHYNAVGLWKEGSEKTLFMPFLERSGIIFGMDKSGVPDDIVTDALGSLAFVCDTLESKGNEAITVGSLVAAKSAYDGSWYRAVVTGTAAAGWKVRYLDFGNSEEVSIIYLLPEKFAQCISLSVCFEVDDIYMRECVPEEFTEDDYLIITVKEIRGDIAIVDVKINERNCVFPAIACSIWKLSFEDTPDADDNAELVGDNSASSVPSGCQNLGILPDSSLPVPSISSPPSSTPFLCAKAEQSPANAHETVRKLPETPIPMEEVGVFPVLVEAIDKVYFQVLNDETCEQLKELQEELNTKVLNEPFNKLDGIPSVGDIVCALFTDDSWYRGVVKTVHAPNDIGICYIDFGNVDSTALENLRHLPDRYCVIPPLSLMVAPSGVHPECTVTQLRNVLTKERDCVWQMKVIDPYSIPARVNLSLNGKTLVEVLGEELTNVNVQTEENLDDAVVANEALTQSSSTLIENAPEVKPSKSRSITFGDMSVVEFPVGSTVVVIITEVKSPEMIFCCLYNTEDISKYDSLATEMTSYAIETGVSDVFDLKENEICLAKSSLDDVFYRAMLLEQRSSEINVFFIDYGSVETVSNKDVRPVPDSFLKLPVQANQCIMHGLKSTVGYSEERCQEFKDIVKVNAMHDVEVVSKDAVEGFYYIRIPSLETELRAKGFLALQ